MKYSNAINALLFGVAIASPSRLDERLARRRTGHNTSPLKLVDGSLNSESTNSSNVDYSSNWTGAVLTSPPSGSTFTSAHGRFTVPVPTKGTGSASSYSSSAWVGIDGDTYGNAILQGGVDFTVSSSGAVSYDSWYEWYPNYAYDFTGFSVAAGNVIQVDIVATSKTTGTVTLTNESTGKSVSKTLSAPSSSASLAGVNAEWIVEDFEENGSEVALSDWGTVVFSDASAGTSTGATVGLTGADVIDLEINGKVYSSVTINSASEVTIKYV